MLKPESAHSLIMSPDRDFRKHVITLLNATAYVGEKHYAETVAEAATNAKVHAHILNMIIDGDCVDAKDILTLVKKVDPILQDRSNARMLLYLKDKEFRDMLNEKIGGLERYCIQAPPQQKNHYFLAFIDSRKSKVATANRAGGGQPATVQKPQQTNLTVMEASGHLKDTVDDLNKLSGDLKNLQALDHIGQRFNGVMGGFAFFPDREGYRELQHLATIIDRIYKTYSAGGKDEIDKKHFDVLMGAAVASYKLLQDLREKNEPRTENLEAAVTVNNNFDEISDGLVSVEGNKQDAVDDILAEAFDKAE